MDLEDTPFDYAEDALNEYAEQGGRDVNLPAPAGDAGEEVWR